MSEDNRCAYIWGSAMEGDQGKQTPEGPSELERRLEIIEKASAKLVGLRDHYIRSRQQHGVEARWGDALRLYYGEHDDAPDLLDQRVPKSASAPRSRVVVNIVGPKTDSGIARLQDLLFPVDEPNWDIRPTPVPKMASMLKDRRPVLDDAGNPLIDQTTGSEVRVADIAQKLQDNARDRADAMRKEIADQLTECHYNAEGRRVIFYAGLFGTGFLKGPVVVNRISQAWLPVQSGSGTRWVKQHITDLRPASFAVDPRYVYPDPGCGNNLQNGSGIFEKSYISKKQLRDLRKEPGYIKENVNKVLGEKPRLTPIAYASSEDRNIQQMVVDGDLYEMWEFYGEFTVAELRAAGLGDPDPDTGEPLISPEADDHDALHGVCVMVNDTIIKLYLNPDPGGSYPYDHFNWKRDEDSVWGYGIPHMMRSQQIVTRNAWRVAMDSAALSAGPQIIVKRGVIRPADNNWHLTPRKVWYANEEVEDVRKAFTVVEFNSHLTEQLAMIDAATKLVDQETNLPTMLQGERGSAPDTVGGMTILMNNANVGIKRLVKQFDDMITVPHITRYYDWNMMYSEREELKGDFQVDARGSSTLVVRDQRNQASMQFAVSFATHPRFADWIDEERLIRQVAEAVSLHDIIRPAEEVLAERSKRSPQEDPRVTVAKINSETAQAVANIRRDAQIEVISRRIALKLEEMGLLDKQESERIRAEIAKVVISERNRENLFSAELAAKAAFGSGI